VARTSEPAVKGIEFCSDRGISRVEVSDDDGEDWNSNPNLCPDAETGAEKNNQDQPGAQN
jgi:hypothetical protein